MWRRSIAQRCRSTLSECSWSREKWNTLLCATDSQSRLGCQRVREKGAGRKDPVALCVCVCVLCERAHVDGKKRGRLVQPYGKVPRKVTKASLSSETHGWSSRGTQGMCSMPLQVHIMFVTPSSASRRSVTCAHLPTTASLWPFSPFAVETI